MPSDLRLTMAKGGLSWTIITAITGAPGFWPRDFIRLCRGGEAGRGMSEHGSLYLVLFGGRGHGVRKV